MARVELDEVVLRPDSQKRLRPVKGALVQVNVRGVGAATVYAAESGAGTVANPLETDSQGRVNGWVDAGAYDLVVTPPTGAPYTQPYEAFGGGAVGPAGPQGLPGGAGLGLDVWASQANPGAVVDWGPIINNLIAAGARNLFFRRVGGANTVYPVSTPIAPFQTAGVREPVVLRGETGHVWQEFVNGVFVKPAVSLRWMGANGESLIRRQGTQTFQAFDLGLEFTNGYTGRLIRAAPDNGGGQNDAAYGGLFVRCWIGPSVPGAAGEDSAGCLVSLIRDVESKYLHCSFYGGQYLIRGNENGAAGGFSNDAEFIGCQFFNPAVAPFCNVGTNWRVIGGVFELTDPVGAGSAGASRLMDTDWVVADQSIEFVSPTFWDITNPAFVLFHSLSGRPIRIKLDGGYIHNAFSISLLGGGSLIMEGLRATTAAVDIPIDLGSATTDFKRVRIRDIELPPTRTIVETNWAGHDVNLDNLASVSSRRRSIRQSAIEVGGYSKSQAGTEPPVLGNFAANVAGARAHSGGDDLFFIYLTTSGVIAPGTRVADLTFNAPVPFNKPFGGFDGPLPVPFLTPIGATIPSVVTTNAVDSYAAGAVVESVANDRTKFSIKLANGIGTGKTLGFVVHTKVLS